MFMLYSKEQKQMKERLQLVTDYVLYYLSILTFGIILFKNTQYFFSLFFGYHYPLFDMVSLEYHHIAVKSVAVLLPAVFSPTKVETLRAQPELAILA